MFAATCHAPCTLDRVCLWCIAIVLYHHLFNSPFLTFLIIHIINILLLMSVDDQWKECNKLLLLVRGDLELLETGQDTSVFLQGI